MRFFLLHCLWLLPLVIGAQVPEEHPDWSAQWIWLPEGNASSAMLARRDFELDEVPAKATFRITASSQYELYVNGEYLRRGPARSAPHHQSFDELEVASYLQAGRNQIAVRVHYLKGTTSYHQEGRGGLLAQLDFLGAAAGAELGTDEQWKVAPDLGWNEAASPISRFQLVVNDLVDFRKRQRGWQLASYDDSDWEKAQPLMREQGWPKSVKGSEPQHLTPPWTRLVPRDVPLLIEEVVPATTLLQAEEITVAEWTKRTKLPQYFSTSERIDQRFKDGLPGFQKGATRLEIPVAKEGKSWVLRFDLGKVHSGTPRLKISGPPGTEVNILTAPYIRDGVFRHEILDSDFADKIILSGEMDEWEATYFKPARYLTLYITGNSEAVHLQELSIRSINYPFKRQGKITSPDAPWIEAYMEATAKTIRTCTTDAYTDNYRERRQYAQTGYYASLGNYWLFADAALQRRYLMQVAQEQEAGGLMPAYAPLAGADYMVILDANCLWIRSMRNYLLYSGDFITARKLLPAARKLMDLLDAYTDELGMLDDPPYPYWLDHSPLDRQGANLTLNGHYLGALDDFADVLRWLDVPDESSTFTSKAKVLRENLRIHLWDSDRQLFADAYIDGCRSGNFSEQANGLALALGIADKQQAKAIAQELLETEENDLFRRPSGMLVATPAMSYFLHKGLCEAGYIEASFAMFRKRFDKMIGPDTNQTLWEEWWVTGPGRTSKGQRDKSRSDAQAESAFPPALFAEYVLGVQPISPGFHVVEVKYPDSGVKAVRGEVPTPLGKLLIAWDTEEDQRKLMLEIPGGMSVELDLNSLQRGRSSRLKLNGKPVTKKNLKAGSLLLAAGKQEITF